MDKTIIPLRIYTSRIDLLYELDDYQSLQFIRRTQSIGEFELHVSQYSRGAEYLQKGNIILLGNQPNKACIIDYRQINLDDTGKASEMWTIKGRTLDGMLNQRITVPPKDLDVDAITADAETVIKHYVDANFVNPVDLNRKLSQLVIATNQNRGPQIHYESRYKVVSDELTTIAQTSGLVWFVNVDPVNKRFIFDVKEISDLSKGNTHGINPVVFSPEFDNIQSESFTDDNTGFKNLGYVGGQGEGADRLVVVVGDGEGLNRYETFIDARDIGDGGEEPSDDPEGDLMERGEEKLAELTTKMSLEGQIITPTDNSTFVYQQDYDIGDIVSLESPSWGVSESVPITEAKEIYETTFRLELTFGEAQPTLTSEVKKRLDDINSVGKQEAAAKESKKVQTELEVQLLQSIDMINISIDKVSEDQENLNEKIEEVHRMQVQQNDNSTKAILELSRQILINQVNELNKLNKENTKDDGNSDLEHPEFDALEGLYVYAIIKGLWAYDDVPDILKEDVKNRLISAGHGDLVTDDENKDDQ